jgi:hypothetical protein
MGATSYSIPTKSGLVVGTAVETGSQLAKYKGGSLLGWNLYAKTKAKIIFYDNLEKAEGVNYGPITLNERESIRDWFGSNGLQFKVALYMSIIEGEIEGVVFADVE